MSVLPLARCPLARLAAFGLSMSVAACAGFHPDAISPKPQPSARFANIAYANWTESEPGYRLYPGDEIEVNVPSAPELNKTVTVQPDGRVSLPLLTPVMVTQRTLEDAEAIISQAYAGQLVRPDVQIIVKAAPLKVFVGGEVEKPGVYDMPGDINALQAVLLAGGFKTSAKRAQVMIIRRGAGGRVMMRTADLVHAAFDPSHTDSVPLRRFDIVYVPRSGISEAGLFVQQYFRDVTPIQLGLSGGGGATALTGTVATGVVQ